MKEFIKIMFAGFEVVSIAICSILCIVCEIPLYKSFVNAKGFYAIWWFILMVICFIGSILFLFLLGIMAYEDTNEKENMSNVWIKVYRHTIEEYHDNVHFAEVLVTKEFAKKYFNERIAKDNDETITFNHWRVFHTASETTDFFQYAKDYNAIIDIRGAK